MSKYRSSEERAMEREIERALGGRAERVVKRLAVVLAACSVVLACSYMFFLLMFHPPDIGHPVVRGSAAPMTARAEMDLQTEGDWAAPGAFMNPLETAQAGWREGVFTFLVAGEDNGFGGTDVVMVVLFDTMERRIEVLSIPRDTLVNVPWSPGRINSIQNLYHRLDGDYDHYIYALRDEVAKLIGYQVNNWVTVDLDGFVRLIDAIGGVEFDVPQRMVYSDPHQNLFINLQPGLQTLDGERAMHLVRFRSFPEGDIQRIRVQQAFLGALADQLLHPRNLLILDDLVRIFLDNVDTDLTFRNLGFFAYEFLRTDRENIRFHYVDRSIGNIFDRIGRASVVTLYLEPWLELINAYFNPFTWEITVDHVEIVTRDRGGSRALVVTEGRFYTSGD